MVKRAPVRTRMIDAPRSTPIGTLDIEAHLHALESQLDSLKAQVRQAQQLANLGVAAATISHEVNNLLTPVINFVEAALASDDTDLREKALRRTANNVRMLVKMSEKVLEVSAAKTSVGVETRLETVVESALESLCRDLSRDGIRLKTKIEEDLTVWVDPLQLQQVLFNLLLNARSAMAPAREGSIHIKADRLANEVVIEIADTGPGIGPEMLTRLFDPLQSSKSCQGNSSNRCSGLGLALCRDLIEENQGSIQVASQLDVGTTFTIRLPAEKPTDENT